VKQNFLLFLSALLPALITGQILYQENFDAGNWPADWTHEGNWVITSNQNSAHEGNDTPPAAVFEWSPQQYDFDQSMITPLIDVGDNEGVLVEFYFALDFYQAQELNGLRISYNGGAGWIEVLNYAIGPGLAIQDNPWSSMESFSAAITGSSDLQLKWSAYGTNSWAIDAWIVDNIKVLALPKLTSVTIESANEDPATATAETNIWLNFTANSDFTGDPYVQINGNACNVDNLGGMNWVAYYTVQSSDPDGPLQFTIDFTDANGIDGQTVKQTTDGSNVIVDNSDPPPFPVGAVTSTGGTVAANIWNSTNTAIQLEVNVPQDSAVASFNYYQGNSLQFDGANDEVSIPGLDAYQATNTLTVESWVKPGVAPADYDGFLSYAMDAGGTQAGFGFAFYLTGWKFFLKTTTNSINYASMAGAQMPVGQWSHMAATYDGSEVKLYRNGALVDSADAMGNVQWSGAPAEMVLGNFPKDGTGHFFEGNIDEVRLWNVVRTKDQIKASREINLTGEETGLVGYWRIDEGSSASTADSTAAANHASVNGATWSVQDSPIEFQTPVYDTGVIVGSAYQLRGRIGINNFEVIGEKDTITAADFNAGTKIVSAPESAFEALTGFAHGDTAQLSALLFDVAGNFSLGDTSTTNTAIDLQANNPNPVSITSNNTFTHLAKTGDVITIAMTYDEDVDLPAVTVEGNAADETDLGGEQFEATYIFSGSETEGNVNYIAISTNDYLGNPGTYNGGAVGAGSSTVQYDRTLPELSPVTIVSNNADTTWAKANDSISVTFTSNEEISADFALSFDGTDDYIELPDGMVSSLNDFTFICWFNTDVNDPWTRLIDFGSSTAVNMFLTPSHGGTNIPRFAIKQSGGGEQQITSSSPLNQGQWYHIAVTIDDNTNTGKMYLDGTLIAENNSMTIRPSSLGNTTNNYFGKSQYNDPYLDGMMDDISIWGRTLDQNEIQSSMYTSLNGDENGLISYWGLNEGSGGTTYDRSSNTNDGVLNNMDPTSAWFFQRGSIPTAKIMSQDVSISTINSDQFRADYTTTITDPEGEVQFEISFSDLAGNEGETVTSTTNNSRVIFDRTAPADFTVGTVVATGGNVVENAWNSTNTGLNVNVPIASDTTLKNGTVQLWAKVGSNAFTAIGSVSTITNSELGSDKLISLDSAGVEALAGFAEEDSIYIKAVMTDRPGNETEGSTSSNRLVIDQVLPVVNTVSYASNFSDTTLATVAHVITVTFTTEPLLQAPTISVSGNAGSVASVSGDSAWAGTYTMQNGDAEGIIAFTINGLVDLRGNPADGLTETTDGTTVTFDNTKPTLDPVAILSSNPDPAWAKVGDMVTVTFNGSELLTNQIVTIASQTATVTDLGSEQYSGQYVMADSDNDEGVINFEILVTDSVGLVSDPVSNTTNTSQVVFDKTSPTLTLVHIESNNANNTVIAIGGDEVYLSFTPAEPIIADSITVTISGQSAVPTLSGDTYTATITLDGTEPSGILSFTIDFMDRSGNPGEQVTSTTDDSFVNHDTGPPEVVSTGIYSSNADSSWAKVGDTVFVRFIANEPLNVCTIIIGGNNSVQSNPSSTTYIGYIVMAESDDEQCIPFTVSYADLGGLTGPDADSTTDGSQVCFDRTTPVISTVAMRSNNVYGDSLAKTGNTDTLIFSISEASRSLAVSLADSDKVPAQSALDFMTTHTFDGSETEGWVPFSLFMTDSAGNESVTVTTTDDGSQVRFDRTVPTFSSVLFYSSNTNDTSLCITGDTIFVEYTPSELLRPDPAVTIAGNPPAEIVDQGESFLAKYEMTGTEEEGYLTYTIAFEDWVGNAGVPIDTTHGTNSSYVLFDQSPPADFSIDTLFVSGGTVEQGYWNSSNDTVTVSVPIAADDESLIDGSCQLQTSINSGPFTNTGPAAAIASTGMLNIDLSREVFVALTGYAESINVQFTAQILDRAGNTTTGTAHEILIHVDETAPAPANVSLTSNNEFGSYWAKPGDQGTLSFTSSEGLKAPVAVLNTDTLTLVSSNSGMSWTATREFIDNDLEGQQTFAIACRDTAGNFGDTVSATTNGAGIILDKTEPLLSALLVGTDSLDLDYSKQSDSLWVYWDHEDGLSGIRDGFVSLGSDSATTDIVAWNSSGGEKNKGLGGLSLVNDNDYFTGVFVEDSAGNHSDTLWGDGIYIDLARPDTGSIVDGQWIMDVDYTPDSTFLKYTWSGFSDNTEIDYYQLAIGTGNDTTNILNWFSTDSTDSITIRNLNLMRDTLYFTYIRAVDLATNVSFIPRTDGVYFDNSEPFITSFTPDVNDSSGFLSVLKGDTITIKFNRPIYSYKVAVNSNVDTQFVSTEAYADSIITIVWQDTLSSYDTVTVFIDSAFAINTLYVTDTLQFFSRLWGDLDDDYDITVADILAFNSNWPNTDLGPYSGQPPHVRPRPDVQADMEDLKAFAKMWQWRYHVLDFDTTLLAARIGGFHNPNVIGRTLKFFLPSGLNMGEILIGKTNLDVTRFRMRDQKPSTFLFTAQDTVSQIKLFSMADRMALDTAIAIQLPNTDEEYFNATIQYRFMNENKQVIIAGTENIAMELYPEKFTVYGNYPNPFNGQTTIRYDLPNARPVSIRIYDLLGRTVKAIDQKIMKPGRHQFTWQGKDTALKPVSSGVYFIHLQAGEEARIQKMLLLK